MSMRPVLTVLPPDRCRRGFAGQHSLGRRGTTGRCGCNGSLVI